MDATDKILPLKRIEALTDGIFAIAMTILVLNIDIPDKEMVDRIGLLKALMSHANQFYSYFLSFWLLGIFWIIQHRQMNMLKKTNQTHIWINIIMLMFICLIPFSSSLQPDYGFETTAAAVFSLNMLIIGFINLLNWTYATKNNRLVIPDFQDKRRQRGIRNVCIFILICIVALAASFIIPDYSGLTYLLIPVIKGFDKKRVAKNSNPS